MSDAPRWVMSEGEFGFAVAWLRMCAVVRGDVVPRLHEPLDLVLLAKGNHNDVLDVRRSARR